MGWLIWATKQLVDMEQLERNWDSYGGDPPSLLAMETATVVLVNVYLKHEDAHPQAVAPRADGGVQMEWKVPPYEFFVHTTASGSIGYLVKDCRGEKPMYQEGSNASVQDILHIMHTLVPQSQ